MRRNRTMTGIGPYYFGDADSRTTGIGDVGPLPSQASGTTWPPIPGWPGGLPGIPGVTLPPPAGTGIPGLPPLGVPSTILAPFLQSAQLYTPWAYLDQGVWKSQSNPGFNVAAVPYASLATLAQYFSLTAPVGFVAIVSKVPLNPSLVDAAFTGTPYQLFSAEAMFQQSDPGDPPVIYFFYWGSLRPGGDMSGGNSDVGVAAASLGATAMFGVQVDAASTTIRSWPTTPFPTAYTTAFGTAPAQQQQTPQQTPQQTQQQPIPNAAPPPATTEASMWGPVLVGTAAALVGFGIAALIRSPR